MSCSPERLPSFDRPLPGAATSPAFLKPAQATVLVRGIASKALLTPTKAKLIRKGLTETVCSVVDVTVGTRWALVRRARANNTLRALHQDRAVLNGALAEPSTEHIPSLLATHHNAAAALTINGQARHSQQLRKHCWGEGVLVGGLTFGTGMLMGSNGLGTWLPAVTVAYTPLIIAGSPFLSAAAGGMAMYQGYLLVQNHRVRQQLPGLLQVESAEEQAQVLHDALAARLKRQRRLARVKGTSFTALAVSAPLVLVGIAPCVAVAAPAALGTLWSVYEERTKVFYKPQLTPEDKLCLGDQNSINNRFWLLSREYAVLKKLKEERRAFFPRGGQGVVVVKQAAHIKHAWRTYRHPPLDYGAAYQSVYQFLLELADFELQFLDKQLELEASSATRGALHTLYDFCRTGRDILTGLRDPVPEEVAAYFVSYLKRYSVLDDYVEALTKSQRGKSLLHMYALLQTQDDRVYLDVDQLLLLLSPRSSLKEVERRAFAYQLSALNERFLLNNEKTRVTHLMRELLDHTSSRLTRKMPAAE